MCTSLGYGRQGLNLLLMQGVIRTPLREHFKKTTVPGKAKNHDVSARYT
jgi:hypothetical protein